MVGFWQEGSEEPYEYCLALIKHTYMAEDKKIFLNGVFWNAIQKYSGLVVNIVVSMVLARLLTPEAFGVVAIASVLFSFLTMICDMGIESEGLVPLTLQIRRQQSAICKNCNKAN